MTEKLVPPHRPLILVVDDQRANRELLEAQLDELGYEVRQAVDGIAALEAVAEREPDLVLLDIDMPRLDGISVCRRLKAHPVRRLIPVVLLTASSDREVRLRGLEAGADDFLNKPFDARELLIRTKVLLKDRTLNARLDATEGVLFALARAVEARDRYTIHHAERVGRYAEAIGAAGVEPEAIGYSHVTNGAYRFTRNPMYLGMALILVGVATLFGTLTTLLPLMPWPSSALGHRAPPRQSRLGT